MPIRIGRHEESEHNIGLWQGPTSPAVPLSEQGHQRARARGIQIAHDFPGFLNTATILESPFLRVEQTVNNILIGAGLMTSDGSTLVQRHVDLRLKEIDFGGEEWSPDALLQAGSIWTHRFKSGQSFAIDGFNNIMLFISDLEDLIDSGQPNFFIVTHGWTVLTFVVAWFNRTGYDFDAMENLRNGELITIARLDELKEKPIWTCHTRTGEWGLTGIRFR